MTTRRELRRSVGSNLRGLLVDDATVRDTTHIDLPLPVDLGSNFRGARIYHDDEERYVSADGSAGEQARLTIAPALSVSSGGGVEVWTRWTPTQINGFIDQAIRDAIRNFYVNMDPRYECVTPRNQEFSLPASVAMVQDIYYRHAFDYENVVTYELWQSSVNDAKVFADYYDYRYPSSVRIDTVSAAVLTIDVGRRNFSGMTHVEGWFKTAEASVDLTLTLEDADGSVGSAFPTITLRGADGWQYLRLALPTPENTREIATVKLQVPANVTVWTNGMWAISEPSINWQKHMRSLWRIDRNTRTLVIQPRYVSAFRGIFSGTSYLDTWTWPIENVAKIIVGGDPGPLTSDSDETEVPDQYVISRATELAYSSVSGGRTTDLQNYREQAKLWHNRALMERDRFPILQNVRRVAA